MAAAAVVPAVADIKPYDTKEPFGALFLCVRLFAKGWKTPAAGRYSARKRSFRAREKQKEQRGKKNNGIDVYEKGRGERASK